MFQTLEKPKRTNQNWKEIHEILVIIGFFFIFYVSQTLLLFSFNYFIFFWGSLSSYFILIEMFNHHKRCSFTQHPESTDQFQFGSTRSLETKKRDNMTEMRRRKLHFKWFLVRLWCPSSGLDYQKVVGWEDT